MKNTLVLKDGSEIKIEPGSSLSDMRVLSDTKSDMMAAWDKLTADNLSEIQIKDSDGLLVAAYQNLVFDSETSGENEDGTVLTSFKLRDKTKVELLEERVAALENGYEVHEGAIGDMGKAVSELAEAGGHI